MSNILQIIVFHLFYKDWKQLIRKIHVNTHSISRYL